MQIVIIGAGPTGAVLALMLVKKGIRVKLIEAARDFKRQFRGEGLMPSGLNALEQMDLLPLLAEYTLSNYRRLGFLIIWAQPV